jgi:hypothetical protein
MKVKQYITTAVLLIALNGFGQLDSIPQDSIAPLKYPKSHTVNLNQLGAGVLNMQYMVYMPNKVAYGMTLGIGGKGETLFYEEEEQGEYLASELLERFFIVRNRSNKATSSFYASVNMRNYINRRTLFFDIEPFYRFSKASNLLAESDFDRYDISSSLRTRGVSIGFGTSPFYLKDSRFSLAITLEHTMNFNQFEATYGQYIDDGSGISEVKEYRDYSSNIVTGQTRITFRIGVFKKWRRVKVD